METKIKSKIIRLVQHYMMISKPEIFSSNLELRAKMAQGEVRPLHSHLLEMKSKKAIQIFVKLFHSVVLIST